MRRREAYLYFDDEMEYIASLWRPGADHQTEIIRSDFEFLLYFPFLVARARGALFLFRGNILSVLRISPRAPPRRQLLSDHRMARAPSLSGHR
jgi:hypothetical protein